MLLRGLALTALLAISPPQGRNLRAEIEALQKKIGLLTGDEVKRETDPAALAASLGHEPSKIFAAVRDFDFHPYRGALRGSLGTLLAGAGNDVDRCLLLKELLEMAPAKPGVRFAFGELQQEQAESLVARALAAVPARSSSMPSADADIVSKVGETEESLAAAAESAMKTSTAHLRRVSGGFAADRAALEAALTGAGIAVSGVEADGVVAQARKLRDHVWLQVEREGKWVDLDPSFAEAAEGWAPVPAARTSATLPPERFHRIAVRLIVERRSGNAQESEALYTGGRTAAELAGRAIHITVVPESFNVAKFTQSLEQQAVKFDRFQPVVSYGSVRENGRVFDAKGRVFQSKDGKFGGDMGDAAGARVLGGLVRKPAPTTLLALRLEVDSIAPGEPPRTATRDLLDRRADATAKDDVRLRIGLIQAWSMWPSIGALNDAFFVDRLGSMLARDGGIPGLFLDHVEKKRPVAASDLAARIDPLPLGLIGVVQSALLLSQGELEPGEGLVFHERPSILFWKEALVPGKPNEVFWRGGVDLAMAPLGVVSKNPAAAARARLAYGLLLTEGESSLLEGRPGAVTSAAARFRAAREAKVPLVVLRERIEGVTLGGAAKRLVDEELKAGRVVVTPREPVELGGRKGTAWWRVDPSTGECLGIGDTGEGQAVSEGVLILDNISIPMVDRCMKFVVCLNTGVGMGGASMADAGRECMTEFMKDFVKDTLDAAIKQFIPEQFRDPGKHFKKEATAAGERMMKDVVDPEYYKLYEKAKRCYGAYNRAKDLGGLRKRVDLLLKMGNDIAKYANEKAEEQRRNR